jgi:hypothetical protein
MSNTTECTLEDDIKSIADARFIIFLILVCSSFYIYKMSAEVFNWQHTKRNYTDTYSDLAYLLFLSTVLFFLGNYKETLDYTTLISIFIGLYGFGYLGELSFMKNSLAGYKDWPVEAWIVYMSGLLIILALGGYHLYEAYNHDILPAYLLALLIPIASAYAAYNTSIKENLKFRPHHWVIFYMLSFFTRFNTTISKVSGGLCIGIFVHGISAYGVDKAFF